MRLILVCLLASAATICGGCSLWRQEKSSALPDAHEVKLDQLVIHSNFELPSHHRLLDELNAQRTDVSNKLGLPVSDEPVQVFLFQNEDRYREFIQVHYPQFPTRRAFFVETDTRLAVFAHWGDRVAEDLRHEVCHGYLHSVVPRIPLWLDEGLAEYFEVPRGQRGINHPHIDELLSLSAQQKWRPDLRRLEQLESPGDLSQTDYAESWAWVHLFLETEPANRDMLHSYLAHVRKSGTTEPISLWVRTLPIDPERSLLDYLGWLKARPRTP